jgi:hypothetical protein
MIAIALLIVYEEIKASDLISNTGLRLEVRP